MKISKFAQCCTVFIISIIASFLLWKIDVKSMLSLLWMLGFPVFIAITCNEDRLVRARMVISLIILSFFGVGITAVIIGYP